MKGFKGSFSIKNVLSPLTNNELNYDGLDVGNGADAMGVTYSMINGELSDAEKNKTIENLLEYCKLDTFAMIKLLESLWKLSEN